MFSAKAARKWALRRRSIVHNIAAGAEAAAAEAGAEAEAEAEAGGAAKAVAAGSSRPVRGIDRIQNTEYRAGRFSRRG